MTQTITHGPALQADPDLAVTVLDQWALVSVSGPESLSYLQGQLTQDVATLGQTHQLAAHCDAKGKMWSSLRLFPQPEGFAYMLRRDVREQQLSELKKYAIFAKVTLATDERKIIGLMGKQARQRLSEHFPELPSEQQSVVFDEQFTLLRLATPSERFIVIADAPLIDELLTNFSQALTDQAQWLAAEIAAGIPVITAATSGQFIPQATNLQALDAISFKKGCYTGQEMVARAKYRGANKRALYWLAGAGNGQVPEAGQSLELKLGDNWRRSGTVLAAVQLCDGQLWVQAVLNNDLEPGQRVRPMAASEVNLTAQPLPYALEQA